MIAAIVPAAGRSQRMGRPKLILPVGGETVIARVVAALVAGGAGPVLVVVPPASASGAIILAEEAERAGAAVVVAPERPADMRASIELGLGRLDRGPAPDAVLIAPGDSLGITPALVARVVEQRAKVEPRAIVVPVYRGRRGHPIALPWCLATEVKSLPMGVGLNALVARHAADLVEFEVDEPGAVADLDTPEDYRHWTGATQGRSW
ncbi:MAG: nucleotidyltransferase family protein [Planctomycetaceae bacterium]|nr:nucleotidyltransferase family protein [Planctomycetaceae bacterium]